MHTEWITSNNSRIKNWFTEKLCTRKKESNKSPTASIILRNTFLIQTLQNLSQKEWQLTQKLREEPK